MGTLDLSEQGLVNVMKDLGFFCKDNGVQNIASVRTDLICFAFLVSWSEWVGGLFGGMMPWYW